MFLGVVKSSISCIIRFAKMFDIDKLLLNIIALNIESLTKSGIDIIPKEKIKDDKTAGWIAPDYVRLARVTPWVIKDMDHLLENNFKKTKK